jgi:hypothetical protein
MRRLYRARSFKVDALMGGNNKRESPSQTNLEA